MCLNICEKYIYIAGSIFHEDEIIDDTSFYYEEYGNFLKIAYLGGLKTPSDMVCQWTFYSYIVFHEVVNDIYRTCLYNLLLMILKYHNLNMDRNHKFSGQYIIRKSLLSLFFSLK